MGLDVHRRTISTPSRAGSGINAAFMVGHSAIRRVVMGKDATARQATDDEVTAMGRLLHEGLEAGGLGFSSSWARTHNGADGHMVPSRYAERDEILRLCAVLRSHEGTSLEFIPMIGPRSSPGRSSSWPTCPPRRSVR